LRADYEALIVDDRGAGPIWEGGSFHLVILGWTKDRVTYGNDALTSGTVDITVRGPSGTFTMRYLQLQLTASGRFRCATA
jgi:hypothetical protein